MACAMIPLSGLAMADSPKVQTLDAALLWLDRLQSAQHIQSTNGWTLNAVFEHLAQSIEMSIEGYPAPKSPLFQAAVGTAAFTFFKMRGRMQHGLAEPIPGAPALLQADAWQPGARRLRSAIVRFQKHTGVLKPHFAYGALSHADFALAHTMHIANHQDEIVTV